MLRKLFTLLLGLVLLTAPATLYAEESNEARARRLINALGCKGCHKLENDGGSLAPELDQIGSRMTRKQISAHLAAHAQKRSDSFMPSYDTTSAEQLEILSEFLYNLQ